MTARLVDGDNVTIGRLEVRSKNQSNKGDILKLLVFKVRFKSVWGTICDDDFGETEAIVACRYFRFDSHLKLICSVDIDNFFRMLGFEGVAKVHPEGTYSPGKVTKGTDKL